MASNYWGIPRTTHDLDFVVQLSDPKALGKVRFGKMPKPGRRGDRSNASTQRGDYTYFFA
jgi:hypothetical protein